MTIKFDPCVTHECPASFFGNLGPSKMKAKIKSIQHIEKQIKFCLMLQKFT